MRLGRKNCNQKIQTEERGAQFSTAGNLAKNDQREIGKNLVVHKKGAQFSTTGNLAKNDHREIWQTPGRTYKGVNKINPVALKRCPYKRVFCYRF